MYLGCSQNVTEVEVSVFLHYYDVSVNPVSLNEGTSLIESESDSPCEASSPLSITIIQEPEWTVFVAVSMWVAVHL